MTKTMKKMLNQVLEAGYTAAILLGENNEPKNWFWYQKEGIGTGYIQEEFAGYHLSSVYNSKNAGTGAVYKKEVPVLSGADLRNALTHKISGTDDVQFITNLKDFVVKCDTFFSKLKIIDKNGEKTPFDLLEGLEGIYIVKHGPTYAVQLYNRMPRTDEKATVVTIEKDAFVQIKGTEKEQIKMLKEMFPYVKGEKLENMLTPF